VKKTFSCRGSIKVRRVGAGAGSVIENGQVHLILAGRISDGRERPVELGARLQIVCSAESTFENLGPGCRGSELGDALLKKRRAECDVLRPTDGSVESGEVLNGFADAEQHRHRA